MFKKTPKEKPPIPPLQRLITFGLVIFFIYIYFTEFQVKEIQKQQLLKKSTAEKIKITNLLSGETQLLDPKTSGKTIVSVNKAMISKAKTDNVEVIQIEIPQINELKNESKNPTAN